MTDTAPWASESDVDPKDPTVASQRGSSQCYFRPDTEELIFIAGSETGAFETHWRELVAEMDTFHQAKADYSRALEAYGRADVEPLMLPSKMEQHVSAVDEAEAKLDAQRERLKKKMGALAGKGASYDEVVELIPVFRGAKTKGEGKAPRYAYVKKGYFTKTKEGRKLHGVSLKGNEKDGGASSIYSKDKNGRARIDTKKLREQLTRFQSPKMKLDLKTALKLIGSDFDPTTLNTDKVLFDWAENLNNSLLYSDHVNDQVDVSAGAQFMRFVSNVGASAQFDPRKKQAAIKGEAKVSLALASGVANMTIYAPDRRGWALKVQRDNGKAFDLGMLRVCVEGELSGFLGGSAQLEAQLQVVVDGKKQSVAGQPGGRLPRFSERKASGHQFYQAMDANDEGLQLSGEAFLGARIDGSLKGSIQWLKPTPPPEQTGGALPALLKGSGQFTSFCTFGGGIAGLAGAGAGGKLRCTFINGKFCFKVAASLCWGAGAKGAFLAEVDAGAFAEFGAWLVYQLYSLDYTVFDVVDAQAFKVYSQFCVMSIAGVSDVLDRAYDDVLNTPKAVNDAFIAFSEELVGEFQAGLEASRGRTDLAKRVINSKQDLLLHTPEAKGILLYLLTRHGKEDHFDKENRTWSLDIYAERKEAVICVLRSIQTAAEWNKVMCRISEDGSSMAQSGSAFDVAIEQENHLIRFLQEGYNRDDDLRRAKSTIQIVKARLKLEITLGYALAFNDTPYYLLNNQSNPYRQLCALSPCGTESERLV
jgi:hypothetical protein